MLVLIHLAFLVAVALYPSIASLELEAFLHGGKPNEALIVSKLNSADDIAYRGALEHLKAKQEYRFLMELGINRIEIGGSDTLFAVDTLKIPSEQVVQESVGKLSNALQAAELHGVSADDVIPSNLVQQVIDFSPVHPNRMLHRIHQITFLVERFDAFKSRFASGDNVDGHVNHDQTRTEQLDTVFRILYGRERPDDIFLKDFNLAKINLDDWDVPDVPRKLTIPHQKVPQILSLAIDDAAKSSTREYFNKLLLLLLQLRNKYSVQVHEYSAFIRQNPPTPPALSGNLLEDIRSMQTLRFQALAIYEFFKLPFPNTENCVFSIYLHDPEERGLRTFLDGAVAFNDLYHAMVFAEEKVIPSFKEVPESYYTSLRDVVLFRGGPVSGVTLDDGRALALFANDAALDIMMYVVRHECGHVLHHRMGYREIRNKLLAISRANGDAGLSQQSHALLSRAHDLLYTSHPLKPVAYVDYKDAIYISEKKQLIWLIDKIFDVLNGRIQFPEVYMLKQDALLLTAYEKSTLRTVRESLEREVSLIENMQKLFYGTFLGSDDDSIGSSSYYAMRNVDEDVAELFQQLASENTREALFVRTRSDTILRQKVIVLLEGLNQKRVKRWINKILKTRAKTPLAVVIVSENGVESLEAIKSVKSYVARKIKRNHAVSLMSLNICPGVENRLRILQQSNRVYATRPQVVFFSQSHSEGHPRVLEEALNLMKVGLDGRGGDSPVKLNDEQITRSPIRCERTVF